MRMIRSIEPNPVEVDRAASHLGQIRARLSNSFVISRMSRIGSHAKATAVRAISDVDLLAVMRRREARWGNSYVSSETFLTRVRDDLAERFPLTNIRRDGQAVVIAFSGGEHSVDVVPAIFGEPSAFGHPVFRIPDGSGGWQRSAPELHAMYFRRRDVASSQRLRHVVQALKLWARHRDTPLPMSSFHLELALASAGMHKHCRPYSHAITLALAHLVQRDGRALRDPLEVAGLIQLADSQPKIETILRSLSYAREHAILALKAERAGYTDEAVRQWRIVFGSWFPQSL